MKAYQSLLLGLIVLFLFQKCNRASDNDQSKGNLEYTYHENDSIVNSIGIKVNGKREGRWLDYDDKGDLISEGYWKEGKRHGKTSAYLRGKLHYVLPFKNGGMTGKYESYIPESGILIEEGYFKNNKEDSLWIFYDEQGKAKEILLYRDGKEVKKIM